MRFKFLFFCFFILSFYSLKYCTANDESDKKITSLNQSIYHSFDPDFDKQSEDKNKLHKDENDPLLNRSDLQKVYNNSEDDECCIGCIIQ